MENTSLTIIKNNIQNEIKNDLDRLAIHYRLHSRIKTIDSLEEKITTKGAGYYSIEGKKVQDVIGFRITTYFIDDVKLLWDYFLKKFEEVSKEYDVATADIFKPLRKNLTCRMAESNSLIFNESKTKYTALEFVDNTFEIQFRTTLSEGWHEVDHALRYKCKGDWNGYMDEDRMLNGIFASLETSDKALKALFDDMSYNHYKCKNWEAMLRMKFRLNFEKKTLNDSIIKIFNNNNEIAKKVFRYNRTDLLQKIAVSGLYMKVSFDNLVFLINYIAVNNSDLNDITPEMILDEFKITAI